MEVKRELPCPDELMDYHSRVTDMANPETSTQYALRDHWVHTRLDWETYIVLGNERANLRTPVEGSALRPRSDRNRTDDASTTIRSLESAYPFSVWLGGTHLKFISNSVRSWLEIVNFFLREFPGASRIGDDFFGDISIYPTAHALSLIHI